MKKLIHSIFVIISRPWRGALITTTLIIRGDFVNIEKKQKNRTQRSSVSFLLYIIIFYDFDKSTKFFLGGYLSAKAAIYPIRSNSPTELLLINLLSSSSVNLSEV